MYGYIYVTTNLINGKKYIGQKRSEKFNESYKGSGKYLWRAINKYGWDNFKVELIEECFSSEELDDREIYWIKYYDAVNSSDYYNLQAGGTDGNRRGSKLSEETRKKMSEVRKGRPFPELSEESKLKRRESQRLSAGHASLNKKLMHNSITNEMKYFNKDEVSKMELEGWILGGNEEFSKTMSLVTKKEDNPFYSKSHSNKSRKLISESRLGDKNPCYCKKWITNGTKNKRVSENELSNYINDGWVLGRYVSQETRNKHRDSALKRERGEHNGRFL